MPAGTLLWAASVGQDATDRRMAIHVWMSTDHGASWSFLSAPRVATNQRGLWEPELSVDAQGRLVVYLSDETRQPRHSQLLAAVSSPDGHGWSAPVDVVASTRPGDRPGMAVVRRIGGGRFAMVYEVVGTRDRYDSAVRIRFSTDGWQWGDPARLGALVTDERGRYFAHAPTLTVAPDAPTLVVIGQELRDPDGTVSPDSGRVVFVNVDAGRGRRWYSIPAPVEVRSPYGHANYTSPMVVLPDGRLLEIAVAYQRGVPKPFYATRALTPPTNNTSPAAHQLGAHPLTGLSLDPPTGIR